MISLIDDIVVTSVILKLCTSFNGFRVFETIYVFMCVLSSFKTTKRWYGQLLGFFLGFVWV